MKVFDAKLMEFMYSLTLYKEFMNSQKISKVIKIGGKKVTDRTIRRWLTFLREGRKFNYFLNAKHNILGLNSIWVLVSGVKNKNVFDIIPFLTYIVKGWCLFSLEESYIAQYYIPYKQVNEFTNFWKSAKEKGIIKDVILSRVKPSISIYQPFHRVLDSNGVFKYQNDPNEYFLKLLEMGLREEYSPDLHPLIQEHPLLVPIMSEIFGEHLSSYKLWDNMKQKLGEQIWDYMPPKLRRRKKEGAAIKYVQHLISLIHSNFDEFIQQVRVSYTPIYINNTGVYLFAKSKDNSEILRFANMVGRHSVQTVISPAVGKRDYHVFYLVTQFNSLTKILNSLKFSDINIGRLFVQDIEFVKDVGTYSKINYAKAFDPTNLSWKYDHKRYMKELKNLSI